MMNWLLDRLFGKRYVDGWPRGVQPLIPWLGSIAIIDPELWDETKHLSTADALAVWRERRPDLFTEQKEQP